MQRGRASVDGPRHRVSSRIAALVVTASVIVAAVGCSAGGEAVSTLPSTVLVANTVADDPGPISPDEQSVRDTIDRYWSEWAIAVGDPTVERPTLDAMLDGYVAIVVQGLIGTLRTFGHYLRREGGGPPEHTILELHIDGDHARLVDCFVDDLIRYDHETDQVVSSGIHSSVYDTTLERRAEGWRLVDVNMVENQPGRSLCP